jgi:hypothetical protein
MCLIAHTNAGKSIVFTCSALVLRSSRLLRPICIKFCVSPLNSLMRDQVEKLVGTGLSGVAVHEVTNELRRGAHNLLSVFSDKLPGRMSLWRCYSHNHWLLNCGLNARGRKGIL